MEVQQDHILILLASASQGTLSRWKQGVSGFSPDVFCMDSIDLLRDGLVQLKPHILMLDNDLIRLDSLAGADLMKLSPKTKVVILSDPLSDEAEWGLFKAGARGCCQKIIEPEKLKIVIMAIQQGELWMRRTHTCRMLEELSLIASEKNLIKKAVSELLANLTRREQEIAALIGNGESNKAIAQRLEITERTVKAHLTEIFRKLNVADRLKLALLVTGSDGGSKWAHSSANEQPPSMA